MTDISEQLAGFRKEIDSIDDQMMALLNRRAQLAMEIGTVKKAKNLPLYVPSREREIFERLQAENAGPFPTKAIPRVFREIISASLSLEYPLRVVYLGPKATFTHVACLQQFGQTAQLMPVKSVANVFDEVTRDRANYGVVPIENSNEGAVTHTLDMFLQSELEIIAEHYLEVSHDLLSNCQTLAEVKRIYSHPQAIEQCRLWLEENVPHVQIVEVTSTARAAQMVSDERDAAAVASGFAAQLYGLRVLANRIETNPQNYTRFLVIGKTMPEPSGHDRTSLLLSISDQPGILTQILEPFRRRELNLVKIESRPIKKTAWNYVFFLDIEGHIQQPEIAEAVEDLRNLCSTVKVLGSYPRAR